MLAEPAQADDKKGDSFAVPTVELDRLEAGLNAFKKVLRSLVSQELLDSKEETLGNGVKEEDTGHDAPQQNRATVLTVFGNAQGSKQLFSSSQKRFPSRHQHSHRPALAHAERLPLHEQQLPAGINSTQILSTTAQDALPASRKDQLFSDLFKARSSLPALTPPKPYKRAPSRDAAVTWIREPPPEFGATLGWTNEKLSAGQWLGWGGISPSQDPVSPEAKRKQRARTLSTGEATAEPPESVKAAQAQAKEDALFHAVYSSFAPSIDNSDAVISEEVKDDVWYRRYGDWFFYSMFEYPDLSDETQANGTEPTKEESLEDEEKAFQEAVKNYDPLLLDDEGQAAKVDEDEAWDKVLKQISDLIESLLSHQRIRHTSLRPNAGQPSPALSSPHTGPTSAEIRVYEHLRDKLAGLVARLPPYVLAKAQGDQLSDLLVSRQILVQGKNYQGVMEEDQASRLAAQAALSTALGSQNGVRPTAPGRASQATPTARPGQAYNPAAGARAGSSSSARAPASSWQSPAQQQAPSMGQRTSYSQQGGYGRPATAGYSQRPGSGPQVNGGTPGFNQQSYQQRPGQTPAAGQQGYGYGGGAGLTQAQLIQQQTLRQGRPGSYYPGSPVNSQAARPGMGGAVGLSNGSRPQTPATPSQSGHALTPRGAAASP